jgi:rare lipoprotein A
MVHGLWPMATAPSADGCCRPATSDQRPAAALRLCVSALLLCLILAGCGGKKRPQVYAPPPPPPRTVEPEVSRIPDNIPLNQKPLWVQMGKASWYGAPYHNRRAANGEVYDMNELTAAHRTLPLNSVVRVTNVKTGRSAVVRITDRGPFVEDRVIDLSVAAAKAVDVWRPGSALVKIEVLETPAPINHGGRWAVQLGGFKQESEARHIQQRLERRYHTARVLAFPSPVGDWWVRVRVQGDDKYRALDVEKNSPAPRDMTFLVRLD